ncbi:hypothetical protein [Parasphingorhabdus sp.]|uniref:hypothetical protein n=1 Tax=Parasphingorhabdus sp. TaxID=2709688 RepID=UPI00300363E4
MRILAPLMIGAVLVTGGCTALGSDIASSAPVASDPGVRTVGEPKSCIQRSSIRSTDVIDDSTIDFRMNNGDIYRNRLPQKCNGLGFEEAFSYETSTSQLCNVDIIRVLDQTAGRLDTRGACGLGQFQQIEKIPQDREPR